MKVLAFNGSPRKKFNTGTLLYHALKGAASQGAETEIVNLYDFNYKGCVSCFACKLRDGESYGKCAYKDDLIPILKKIEQSDAIIFGSPIYLGSVTGEMRSFLERLIFPYLVYDENYSTLFNRKIPTGFIYTMNINDSQINEMGYKHHLRITEMALERIFGTVESLFVTDTYQFDDYAKYVVTAFDPVKKAQRRTEEFPNDCKKAFAMGARFAKRMNADACIE